mmetsp:Transcript_22003/g.74791  ORF Transcript_22003/g.74791 Transcript_22003/m.74791 type:complete len:166 (+) Transcript_22003:215-712(+)
MGCLVSVCLGEDAPTLVKADLVKKPGKVHQPAVTKYTDKAPCFCVRVELDKPCKDFALTALLVAVGAKGYLKGLRVALFERNLTKSDGNVHIISINRSDNHRTWPRGKYKIEVRMKLGGDVFDDMDEYGKAKTVTQGHLSKNLADKSQKATLGGDLIATIPFIVQ